MQDEEFNILVGAIARMSSDCRAFTSRPSAWRLSRSTLRSIKLAETHLLAALRSLYTDATAESGSSSSASKTSSPSSPSLETPHD